MAYGVPSMLLSIPGEATFANYKEARLAFWENTIFFWLNYIKQELNNWFYPKGDPHFVDYILDDVPALSVKRDALWERAQKSDFLTINEKREMVGYDDHGDAGDVILVPVTMTPLSSLTSGEEEEEETEEEGREALAEQGYNEEEIDRMLGLSDEEGEGEND